MPPSAQSVAVTVDDTETAGSLTVGVDATVAIISDTTGDGNLSVTGSADVAGLIQVNSTGDPTLTLTAAVTVESTGKIEARGGWAQSNSLETTSTISE